MPLIIPRIRAALPQADILVVDDNSPDGTADKAEALGGELGRVHVLRRTGRRGLGPAYSEGFSWGLARGYDVLVGMDADLSHEPAELPRLVRLVEGGADVAIGSRYVPGGRIPDWPLYRRLLSRWGNRYATGVLRLPVRDATSGFRAFRATALSGMDLHAFRANGYGYLIEVVYRLVRNGGRVVETPIVFVDRQHGDSKMSGFIVAETMLLVTLWGISDRLRRRC